MKLEVTIERENEAIHSLLKKVGTVDVSANREATIRLHVADAVVYCAVFLIDAKVTVAIHSKWMNRFDSAKMLNRGLNRASKHIIFYSTNQNQKAYFRTTPRVSFSATESGVYNANILRFFGKYQPSMNIIVTVINLFNLFSPEFNSI